MMLHPQAFPFFNVFRPCTNQTCTMGKAWNRGYIEVYHSVSLLYTISVCHLCPILHVALLAGSTFGKGVLGMSLIIKYIMHVCIRSVPFSSPMYINFKLMVVVNQAAFHCLLHWHKNDVSKCNNLYTDLQALVDANQHKAGIAFLCVSTGDPRSGDFIANSTALEKMEDCLGTKLGYLTISVGTNMTTSQFGSLVSQVTMLKLPESYNRVMFYFFGHGNDDSLQFADGAIERQHIISKFQLISPTNENLFKIFIFDSCRMVNVTMCEAIQESSGCKALAGEAWEAIGQYPESVNTLVINATTCNSKAYYRDIDGCGLLTKFFTELAPTRNESLRDLLAVMRQKIAHETQMDTLNTTQILVYEDRVMGIINLLAESQGTGIYSCIISNLVLYSL